MQAVSLGDFLASNLNAEKLRPPNQIKKHSKNLKNLMLKAINQSLEFQYGLMGKEKS